MRSLTKYDPMNIMNEWIKEMNRAFNRPGLLNVRDFPMLSSGEARIFPETNIEETVNSYHITTNIPGVDPKKDLEITLQNSELTIKGKIEYEHEQKDRNYLQIERSYGTFSRTFYLANVADNTKVNATYDKGVLTITVPKPESSGSRKIEVKTQ